MHFLRVKTLCLAGLLAASALGSGQSPKLLIELNDDELSRRVPELAGVHFDHDETLVRTVLQPALEAVNQTFDKFADVSAAERIYELRLENAGARVHSQTEHFRYVAAMAQNSLEVHEVRLSTKDNNQATAGQGGFVTGDRFIASMELLLPEFESQLRIRAIGRQGGLVVFAFAQNPGAGSQPTQGPAQGPAQGLVWIDAKRLRPVRLHCETTRAQDGAAAERQTVDLTFTDVHFAALDATLLLPVRAGFDVLRGDERAHAVHTFSDFHLYGRDDANNPELAKKNAGVSSATAADDDAFERLGAGVAAMDAKNAAGAVAPLREAVRLDATLAAAHYHLARALRATGDAAGAEAEARAALSGKGAVSAAHNLLGILLTERGAAADALVELRETAQLAPDDATAHGNLSKALETSGDRAGALAELRRAVELAPANEALKARLSALSGTPPQEAANANEPVIRVDVRQVLVPVVVLDNSGHNVSDLKQSDFRVLEDGVEQAITSFRVETSGEAGVEAAVPTAAPKAGEATPAAPKPASAARPRNTYLIVIDAMDSDVGSLYAVREALKKFFASEAPGDSQYGLFLLGQPSRVLVNMTRDPAVILAALDEKAALQIAAAGGAHTVAANDIRDLMRTLDDARAASDQHAKGSGLLGQEVSRQVEHIAAVERNQTAYVLGALRDLVRELSKGHEHRTLILISDGFQLTPGLDAQRLVEGYFPSLIPRDSVPGIDRMQPEFDAVVKIAARANVIINTIDSRGVYTPAWTDASLGASGSATNPAIAANIVSAMNGAQAEHGLTLTEFSAATGGTSYQNSNDLFAGIRKAVADGRNFYTLGYVSTNAAMDGKFRNITVEVKGHKLTLRAKRGYWATAN
jgi:VWFA-related protein